MLHASPHCLRHITRVYISFLSLKVQRERRSYSPCMSKRQTRRTLLTHQKTKHKITNDTQRVFKACISCLKKSFNDENGYILQISKISVSVSAMTSTLSAPSSAPAWCFPDLFFILPFHFLCTKSFLFFSVRTWLM